MRGLALKLEGIHKNCLPFSDGDIIGFNPGFIRVLIYNIFLILHENIEIFLLGPLPNSKMS